MSNWLTHFFLFCVKLFPTIMSLWKRPYLLKCNHARQEKINKSLRLNKLRLKQGSLTFDNDLVMPHAFFELFHTLSPVMHIQGCAAADLHHDSFENKQMLLTVQQALKNRNGWERLEIWGAIALRGHCAPYPMVSARVVLWGWSCCQETKLTCCELPRGCDREVKSSEAVAHVHHLLQLYNSEASNVLYDTAGCSLKIV